MDINTILQENGFTDKEAKIYLSALELGNSPASSIARHCGENRVTTYTILKDLVKRSIANETIKNKVKYYNVIDPQKLVSLQKEKSKMLEKALPELLAITNSTKNKPKVYFHDGLEGLKYVYKHIILTSDEMPEGEPFLTFVGTNQMDGRFMDYLTNEFTPRRLKTCKRKTQSIIAKDNTRYTGYSKEKHGALIIDDPVFDMANEIIVYGNNKIALAMYSKDELSALVVESQTLHDAFKSMFKLIRKAYKK